MKKFGKNIKLFLIDGDVNGRWICELSNWTGKAYKIPRNLVKECADREELQKSGVYFLFGMQEDGKPLIYIGESEVIYTRLLQHLTTKDYWNECIVFISKDEYLNKAHIKYLEHRFYSSAKEANRYVIKNDTVPTKSNVSEGEEAELEEFIYNAKILIGTLGHKAFEPVARTIDTKETLFYFERKKGERGKGVGIPTSEGFVLFKGAFVAPDLLGSANQWVEDLRNKHKDKIKNNITTEDILFSSPSAASAFLCGGSSNGLVEWKTADGIELKQMQG
ncbi:GIY-YIG nuclease family protein [Sporanaerobacter acetigenes]|uniref:GIY-YIG nuclease family protein n=1 Tax=Sporanaerobacter acetigenes TaxID=165813 RepID=UPI0010440A74|nr:GIY-YIG nuclease family protein [Sporanaerobacter acetigenes]